LPHCAYAFWTDWVTGWSLSPLLVMHHSLVQVRVQLKEKEQEQGLVQVQVVGQIS
jgi:hypothetical protein